MPICTLLYFPPESRVRIAFACDPDAFAGDSATVGHAHLASILGNKRESQHPWELNSFFSPGQSIARAMLGIPFLVPSTQPEVKTAVK